MGYNGEYDYQPLDFGVAFFQTHATEIIEVVATLSDALPSGHR